MGRYFNLKKLIFLEIVKLYSHFFGEEHSVLLLDLTTNVQLEIKLDPFCNITGYAALRRFGLDCFIAPIISPSFEETQKLIYQLAAPLAGQFMRLDLDRAFSLSLWLAEIGLKRTQYGIKMCKNQKTEVWVAAGLCSKVPG